MNIIRAILSMPLPLVNQTEDAQEICSNCSLILNQAGMRLPCLYMHCVKV